MEIDWAVLQRGKERVVAFAAVLGYNRSAYIEFVSAQTLEILLKCHAQALVTLEEFPEKFSTIT